MTVKQLTMPGALLLYLVLIPHTVVARNAVVIDGKVIETRTAGIPDDDIRYSFPNDENSSLSIIFTRVVPPYDHENEWVIKPCITATQFSLCDYSSTRTSTLDILNGALSHSIDAFLQENPDARIKHLYVSTYLTSETLRTFLDWISPAQSGESKADRTKLLQDRLRSYQFSPLTKYLKTIFSKHGYIITNVGYAVEPGIVLVLDPDSFLTYLAHEHSWYYIALEPAE